MSVVTLPRRVETRAPTRRPVAPAAHRPARRTLLQRWRVRSTTSKLALVTVLTVSVILVGSSYAAERQVQIHSLQTQLLQQQAAYAAQVAALTNTAAPARVATQAGSLHLVVPSSVTQIPTVSLDSPLPPPKLIGSYSVQPRVYP